jgi:branched-subunit amino acid transport protein
MSSLAGGDAVSLTVGDLNPYLALVLVGFLPNEVWRWLGLIFARRIDEASELMVWVRAVATAILAGIIAQLVLTPPGALASVPPAIRLCALGLGFLAFLLVRRSVFAGVLVGEASLIGLSLLFG